MKNLMIAAITVLAMIGTVRAYEVEGNPDRKISFGFNYDRTNQNSDYNFRGFTISDFTKVSGNSFLFDARLPLNSFFTLAVHGGIVNQTNDIFTSEKVSYSGYDIGFGFRVYIP